jgi:hypothetical protein
MYIFSLQLSIEFITYRVFLSTSYADNRRKGSEHFHVLFLLVDKKSSLVIILCGPSNGIGNLAGNIKRFGSIEGTIDGG